MLWLALVGVRLWGLGWAGALDALFECRDTGEVKIAGS